MATPTVPHVMIASPTPGEVKTVYSKTVMANLNDLATHGIPAQYETVDSSSITKQRNALATRFLETDCTHLFFIDSDTMAQETLCRTLLTKQKAVIGIVCAMKTLHFDRVAAAIKRGVPLPTAILFGFDWTFYRKDPDAPITIENGIAQVDQLGFGGVLIERRVFTMMIDRGVVRRTTGSDLGWARNTYNFFGERSADVANNELVNEDVSFSRRWTIDCECKLWALVDYPTYHVGDFAYGGNFFDFLTANANQSGSIS